MKKLLVMLLALLLLAGCAPGAQPMDATYCSFTDSTGAAVTLAEKPQTVAVLFSSYAEVWSLAGGTVDITVGESVERGFAEESAILVDSGAGKTIDTERLIAAQPDLVIGSADIPAQVEACEALAKAGVPAALFRVDTFDDYLAMLRICTRITGETERYTNLGTEVQLQVSAVINRASQQKESPRILFIRAGSKASATKAKRAPENFVCTMLQELGAQNIADEAPVLLDGLSLEYVMQADPEFIFLTTMGDEKAAKAYIAELFAQEGWRELTAVKEGSYAFLDKDLFHFKPNARWAEAYRLLAELLYPEIDWYA